MAASASGASTRQKIVPLGLVDPVAQVVDVVVALRLQVCEVSLGDVFDGDPVTQIVYIHEQRHDALRGGVVIV